jgi:hypothetical protein
VRLAIDDFATGYTNLIDEVQRDGANLTTGL